MTRKETAKKVSKLVYGTKMGRATCFERGVDWADRHPRKGLVDIDKACAWLAENFIDECGHIAAEGTCISFNTKPAVEAFRKAMEEQI